MKVVVVKHMNDGKQLMHVTATNTWMCKHLTHEHGDIQYSLKHSGIQQMNEVVPNTEMLWHQTQGQSGSF